MNVRNKTNTLLTFAVVAMTTLLLATSTNADLILIGDANLGGTGADTAGQSRLNIELDAANLAAGTYDVLQYELDTDGTGNVTPLLLQRNALNDGYNVLWVGADIAVSGTTNPNITTLNYTTGTEQFSLTGATDVFVGAWHDGGARVRFSNGGGTDHDGGGLQMPNSFVVAQNILDSDITNSGLGRTYMMQASVGMIPEPSSLALLGLGGLLIALRRRG